MNLFYIDSSAWVKYHLTEAGSDWITAFWSNSRVCACSDIGAVEVLAALVRRLRHTVTAERLSGHFAEVRKRESTLMLLPLDALALELSRTVIERYALRGADAVHLASAMCIRQRLGVPASLIASDAELLAAARSEGFDVLDPVANPPMPA